MAEPLPHDEAEDKFASDPTLDPASTARLIFGAIAMQAGTVALTKIVDRAVLGELAEKPSGIPLPKKPGKIRGLTTKKLAVIATKSLPGAAVVAGGMIVKYVFDRGGQRKQAKRNASATRSLPSIKE